MEDIPFGCCSFKLTAHVDVYSNRNSGFGFERLVYHKNTHTHMCRESHLNFGVIGNMKESNWISGSMLRLADWSCHFGTGINGDHFEMKTFAIVMC